MDTSKPHFKATISLVHSEREAAPFLFGYLLRDISDDRLCAALAAYRRHAEELEELEQRSDEPDEQATDPQV